jgi:hypothetical protein
MRWQAYRGRNPAPHIARRGRGAAGRGAARAARKARQGKGKDVRALVFPGSTPGRPNEIRGRGVLKFDIDVYRHTVHFLYMLPRVRSRDMRAAISANPGGAVTAWTTRRDILRMTRDIPARRQL